MKTRQLWGLLFLVASHAIHSSAEEKPAEPRGFSCEKPVVIDKKFSMECEAEHKKGRLKVVLSGVAYCDEPEKVTATQLEIVKPHRQVIRLRSSDDTSDGGMWVGALGEDPHEYMNLLDIDFDGIDELRIFDYKNWGTIGYGICYHLFKYDEKSNAFRPLNQDTEWPDFESWIDCSNVDFYPKKRIVRTTERESARRYHFRYYKWEGGRLRIVEHQILGVGFTFEGFDQHNHHILDGSAGVNEGFHSTMFNEQGLIVKEVHTKCVGTIPCPLISSLEDSVPSELNLVMRREGTTATYEQEGNVVAKVEDITPPRKPDK